MTFQIASLLLSSAMHSEAGTNVTRRSSDARPSRTELLAILAARKTH